MILSKQRILGLAIVVFLMLVSLSTKLYGGYLYTLTIPIMYNVIIKDRHFNSLGLSRDNLKIAVIWGVISGIILSLLCAAIFKMLNIQKINLITNMQDPSQRNIILRVMFDSADIHFLRESISIKSTFFYFIYMLFAVGLGEEIFWRGFIQNKLSKKFSKTRAILTTTAVFTLFHLYLFTFTGLKTASIMLFLISIASLIWGFLYFYYRNIYSVAISHGIVAFIMWRYLFFEMGTVLF